MASSRRFAVRARLPYDGQVVAARYPSERVAHGSAAKLDDIGPSGFEARLLRRALEIVASFPRGCRHLLPVSGNDSRGAVKDRARD